jgi:signal transduction histidine kinase
MLGKSDHDYFPKKEADIFWEKDELVFEGGQENINTELWTDAKGIIHTIVTKKTLYADAKGNKFIVGIIRDISEIVKIQEKLKEAMEVKSNFTSMVSHELRTPLAAIKTGVKLVLDGLAGEVNSEQRDFLSIVKNNVDRLDRLINNVLDLQKLEAGKIQFNITPNDINEVAREIYLTMLPVAKEKGLEFKLQLDAAPVSVQFDRDSITQVLTNLFNNAFKFTENGGVTITVSHDDNFIQVVVSDTGLGIKKEDIPKLFHAFEQLDRKRGRKIEGSGLGLAICKEIIEKHRGMIWVESELGKGSIFYFTLPR